LGGSRLGAVSQTTGDKNGTAQAGTTVEVAAGYSFTALHSGALLKTQKGVNGQLRENLETPNDAKPLSQ